MMIRLTKSWNGSACSRAGWWLGLVGVGSFLATCATAQTFTNLHSFNNDDGAFPQAGLILSSNTLYGAAQYGGNQGNGTLFALLTDGSGFTNLHHFTATTVSNGVMFPYYTNSDGANPAAGLIWASNVLFGTAVFGGSGGAGTLFKVNTDGTGFTNVYTFSAVSDSNSPRTNSDGANPTAALVLMDNTLYGTAEDGGSGGAGTVFRVNADGSGFTNLHNFTEVTTTNTDGAFPRAGLILSDNSLYGTTYRGGFFGAGTVFRVNTDGSGFTNLHNFTGSSDGGNPQAGLVLSGNILYGTASAGGSVGTNGTVFRINTDGTAFTNLYGFTGSSDGEDPRGALILPGSTLYGTAYSGGDSGHGTIYSVKTNGQFFTAMYSYTAGTGSYLNPTNSDGAFPADGLILSGNMLYGTAIRGGPGGVGTVFRLTVVRPTPVFQAVTLTNKTVSLTWTTLTGELYQLQYKSNVNSGNWSNLLGSAVAAAGATLSATDSVTNSSRRFYRAVLLP